MSSLSLSAAVTLGTVSGQEPQSVTILKGHVQSDAIHANDECPGEKKISFFCTCPKTIFMHVQQDSAWLLPLGLGCRRLWAGLLENNHVSFVDLSQVLANHITEICDLSHNLD